jgi:hypothetical protein
MPAKLLNVAIDLRRRFGWSIIPVNGKKSVGKWKQAQRRAATRGELRKMFNPGKSVTGLAVVCGPVSGNLVCRDFDTKDGYRRWAEKYPKTAKRVPTVKTPRGFHVYFRGPEGFDQFDEDHRYGKGEYRGTSRQYTVLPPSKHPDGGRYRWAIKPRDEIPRVAKPWRSGLRSKQSVTSKEADLAQIELSRRGDGRCVLSVQTLPSNVQAEIEATVASTVPSYRGHRHWQLWELIRGLKSIPQLADQDATALRGIVQDWHRRVQEANMTRSKFNVTWAEFRDGWDRYDSEKDGKLSDLYRLAAERPTPPWIVERYTDDDPRFITLVKLCIVLHEIAGEKPFPLDGRSAAKVTGIPHRTVALLLRMLRWDKILKLAKAGSAKDRRCHRYRYIGPPS